MKILKWISKFWNVPSYAAYLFIAPVFILLFVFTIIPLMSSFLLSMTDLNLFLTKINWVGFQNFIDAFHDERFVNSLKISIEFAVIAVPLRMVISLFVAAMLARNSLFNKAMRTVYFLPVICSATVIGIMWELTLNGYIGLIPYWLTQIGLPRIDVFHDLKLALPAIGFLSIWGSFGITAIIFLAAMKTVPNELYESAEIEGASKKRQFFSITFPSIMPTFWFLLITNIIGSLQVFDLIYVITNGGPQYTTETTVAYIYYSFSTQYKAGYASAMAEIFFFIIMIVTLIMYKLMLRQEKD
jgi:multiple sugar transport system permease protein